MRRYINAYLGDGDHIKIMTVYSDADPKGDLLADPNYYEDVEEMLTKKQAKILIEDLEEAAERTWGKNWKEDVK
jgi:hypothetical protein